MVEVRQTETFDRWFRKPRDSRARARIQVMRRGEMLIVLLAGGDKGSQDRDISTALVSARSL